MLPRIVIGLVCAVLPLAPATHGAEAVQDERIATYKEFRAAFDAADYAKALPLAAQVVQQTRSQFGADSLEMVNPRTNVATTWYRMGKYGEALDGYREALTQLDQQDDATNPLLIRPLHGIGATLHAMNRDAEAIAPLKRAVDITRNREGMQSASQMPLLKELVACYMSTGRVQEAGTEQVYLFNLAEATYGRNDIRMLGPLDDYARWNEAAGRYSAARTLHIRAVQLADSILGNMTLQSVNGLRGIARTYRLAFVNGESEEAAAAATADSFSSSMLAAPVMITPTQSAEGERALRIAIQRLAAAIPAQPQRLGEVQTDLGDWYLTGGASARALPVYREAWNSLALAGGQKLLAVPVPLTYHPPPASTARGLQDPALYDAQTVEVRLSIEANGNVRDAVVVNPVAEREPAERAVAAALKRSIFRPVINEGAAITSTDTVFREQVYVKRARVK